MAVKWDTLLDSKEAAKRFFSEVFTHYESEIKKLPKFKDLASDASDKRKLQALGILFTSVKLANARTRIREDARKWAKKKKAEGATQSEDFLTNDYIKGKEGQTGTIFNYKIDEEYKRENGRLQRINCAFGIAYRGNSPEHSLPSDANGLGTGDGNDEVPPPPNHDNSTKQKCDTCQKNKKGQKAWFKSRSGGEYCDGCYRKYFINNVLQKLPGWNELDSETKEHYLLQIDKCKKGSDFKILKQLVIATIQKLAATCTHCQKEFHGKRWGIEKEEDKLFCSENCAENWQKKKKNGSDDQTNSQENEGDAPITDSGEDDDNSEANNSDQSNSNSDNNSGNDSTDDEDENNNDNQLPENIQEIAQLPLPQAQQKTEQEIIKLLKENGISEQELNQEKLLKGTDWKSYLKKLGTPQKVAEFMEKMQQSIAALKAKKMAEYSSEKEKDPKNDKILPITILVVSFLALTSLILIVRKRRQKRF